MTHFPVPDFTTELKANTCAFAQRLTVFDEALRTAHDSVRPMLQDLRDAVVRMRQTLNDIHVPCLSPHTLVSAVCFDCAQKNMDVFYTSRSGGYCLCEACFNRRDQHGRARYSHKSADTLYGRIL